jgi:peptidoglycan/xylan/chitin deacetylase (PgdA/CDA1 family)
MAVQGLLVSFGLLAMAVTGCGTVQTSGTAVAPDGGNQAHVEESPAPQPQGTNVSDDDPVTGQTVTSRTTNTVPTTGGADPVPGSPRADVIVGSTGRRPGPHIGLTFDDGPDPTWTPQVLALLAQYHVKATFCLVGTNAKAYPALVRDIVAGGHALCDHTMHHDERLPNRPAGVRRAEIADGLQAILAAAPDAQVPYYRAPAGAFSRPGDPDPDSVQRIAVGLGMQPLAWSIDTVDWTRPGTPAIVAAVERAGSHDVVLLHDAGGDRAQTVAALRIVLPWLVARGYQFDFPA